MTPLDSIILFGFVALLGAIAIRASSLARSVADFMVANRCAGRYLLTAASAMSALGAIQVVQEFQRSYEAGFAAMWWNQMLIPIGLAVSLSGWVVYRWRSTRILTQAQLFEQRYSRNYRIFAGILAFLGGVAGLGIFPGVAARFFERFLYLPSTVTVFGGEVQTYQLILISLIGMATFVTFIGGQIVIIISDTVQAVFTFAVVTALAAFFFWKFDWATIVHGLEQAPIGESKLNPLETANVKNYNMWFYLIMAFNMVFIWPAGGWNQAANSSGLNPHETRMAGVLARLREIVVYTPLYVVPVFVFAILQLPEFQPIIDAVNAALSGETIQMQRELRVPMALSAILPVGLLGAFAAMMFAAYISTDQSYYLQFGGMFVQDVILPFRKTHFSPRVHMILLRGGVIAVAVLVYLFSTYFTQRQDITMYFSIIWSTVAGGIYIPFLGALYWRRATTLGCWASAILGVVLSICAFGLERHSSVIYDRWEAADGSVSWNNHVVYFRNEKFTIAAGSAKAPIIAWSAAQSEYVGVSTMAELAADPDAFAVVSVRDGRIVHGQTALWRWFGETFAFVPRLFELNGAQRGFLITVLSALIFVGVSLLDGVVRRQPVFDLDKLLHRGRYAVAGDLDETNHTVPGRINRILNITAAFTRGDRILYYALIGWGLLGAVVFAIGTVWGLTSGSTNAGWATYWQVYLYTTLGVAVIGSIFLIRGAIKDLGKLWFTLDRKQRDDADDGMVR
jgi:SSS family solute:Na+ symporter